MKRMTRIEFVAAAGAGLGLALGGCAGRRSRDKGEPAGEEIGPVEDLMREHGILNRVLLVYEEGARRLQGREDLPSEALAEGASVIRRFVEEYHEQLEEEYLFPRFEKAGRLVELVKVLRVQHQAGRRLTDDILRLSTPSSLRDPGDRERLADDLRRFVRMYRPHGAREDTVLFPAFRGIVPRDEYGALGEEFEGREDNLFGDGGFAKFVGKVERIERMVGIDDLARFTPS